MQTLRARWLCGPSCLSPAGSLSQPSSIIQSSTWHYVLQLGPCLHSPPGEVQDGRSHRCLEPGVPQPTARPHRAPLFSRGLEAEWPVDING